MLKDILVIVDSGPRAPALDLAMALAAQHEAQVTGLFVTAPVRLPPHLDARVRAEVGRVEAAVTRDGAAAVEARFRDAARGVIADDRIEWYVVTGDPDEVGADLARCADLVMIGQIAPDQFLAFPPVHPETVLFAGGRPVLMVPYAGAASGHRVPPATVMIAWNGSSAAARAVGDAVPILRRANKVIVLSVNPPFRARLDAAAAAVPGADLVRHLSRHGIRAKAHHVNVGDIEPGDILLNQAADLGVDLIVMGAYGRSRLRELVLGGTTRHILRHMTVPVLLSH
ncbi:MAG: universal stress protein [Azospirillaceae bacterium]|nr:universal stress protein [Azospirillaceae bacterium]